MLQAGCAILKPPRNPAGMADHVVLLTRALVERLKHATAASTAAQGSHAAAAFRLSSALRMNVPVALDLT
jgi:hypothetical protein